MDIITGVQAATTQNTQQNDPFSYSGPSKGEDLQPAQVEEDDNVDMTITKELRQATKDVHKLSDVLVNAKFALALSDDGVWYDGLLAFHEVYKFFEDNLPTDLLPAELHRTRAFEKDIEFYYGSNWKQDYKPRPSIRKYLKHLEEVKAKSNILLFAYAFQMYMAIMSGGQLLQKKRMIARKLWRRGGDDEADVLEEASSTSAAATATNNDDLQARPMPVQVDICPDGCAATYFPERIPKLKAKLRRILNRYYANFDDETRAEFIKESRNVFRFNSDVVRSIKGVNNANIRKLAMVLLFAVGVYVAIKMTKHA